MGLKKGKEEEEEENNGEDWIKGEGGTGELDESEDRVDTTFLDVKRSLADIKSWNKQKKRGYAELSLFCVFMVLYIVMLSLQLQVGPSWGITSAFQTFLMNSNNYPVGGVFTQQDFWKYLIDDSVTPYGGIMPFLFDNQWYNGAIFTTDEEGYILQYNKLVGGVLIAQVRGVIDTDGCAVALGPSAYEDFYPNCYTSVPDTLPFNTTYNASTAAEFSYDPTQEAYVAFFGVAAGATANIQKALDLRQQLWTDKGTRIITIKFAFYNAQYGLFSFCLVQFNFDIGGIFTNGNAVQIQSINMEPYRNTTDMVRLALEIIFMVWVSFQFVSFVRTNYQETQKIDKQRRVKVGLRALVNLWTAVDAANLGLFAAYVGFRCQVLSLIYANPIVVPTNDYVPILEQVSGVQNQQLVVNFLNIFIGLLRFFKYYQFQARLNVLNKTFANAYVDLYHYMMMFCVIFGGYAVMAHILFGPSLLDYNSVGNSLMTLWQMLLGNFNYFEIEYVNKDMAAIFFVSFMFLILIVLVNILLAILIRAYTKAKKDDTGMTIIEEIGRGVLKSVNRARGASRYCNDDELVKALLKLQEKGAARVTSEEIGMIIAKSLVNANPLHVPDPVEVSRCVSVHPFLYRVTMPTEEEMSTIPTDPKLKNYPLELIDNIESVLRENAYLRHRVQADARAEEK